MPTLLERFQALSDALVALRQRPAPRFDLEDPVMLAYPPLANYSCFAFRHPNIPMGCGQSTLTLAYALHSSDNGNAPEPLITEVPDGLTINEMINRRDRLGMAHFPVVTYDLGASLAAGEPVFIQIAGRPRTDNFCIVFVPEDLRPGPQGPPFLPRAHWTFATVVSQRKEPAPLIHEPLCVYTSFPIDDLGVYWRARVTPENKNQYEQVRSAGRACDCEWCIDCDCCIQWGAQQPGATLRVSLAGPDYIPGSLLASVVGLQDTRYSLAAIPGNGLKLTDSSGLSTRVTPAYGNNSVVVQSFTGRIATATRTNSLAPMTLRGRFSAAPLILDLYEFDDPESVTSFFKAPPVSIYAKFSAYFSSRYIGLRTLQFQLPTYDWGAYQDLHLRLPRREELLQRLAMRSELTEAGILDVLRRMSAEERWDVHVDRDELSVWISRLVKQRGYATVAAPTSDVCWSCWERVKTYRHLCRSCKHMMTSSPPVPLTLWDACVTHVGFRFLWSKTFSLPAFDTKSGVEVHLRRPRRALYTDKVVRGRRVVTGDLLKLIQRLHRRLDGVLSARGRLNGPMFLNQEPTCFPRGDACGVLSFLVRLGAARVHVPQRWFYDILVEYVVPYVSEVSPETWPEFLSHFSGSKRAKMESAKQEINEGWLPHSITNLTMDGFVKAEKSYSFGVCLEEQLPLKLTEKPRFICSPPPMILASLGPYTHAQTKWLAATFTWSDRLFYAGCATPADLNSWLARTLDDIPEPYSVVDDITAIDANHSELSFEFHRRIRRHQFPYLSDWIAHAFAAEEQFSVRVGMYLCIVAFVNASGVSDTSYKNSLLCLFIRLFAVAHAFHDIRLVPDLHAFLNRVKSDIWTAASGDDGLTRLPNVVAGFPIEEFSLARYRELWAWAGFDVKVSLVPPNRWRMATFLACRPVWGGECYQWVPEPARRLRGMFWQIDNTMHPIAWARGVASQVLGVSRALPVLSHICEWYLRITTGPIAKSHAFHEYNFLYQAEYVSYHNARATEEFCNDYHVSAADIDAFLSILESVCDPLVNLDTWVLRRIFAEES